MEQVISLLLPKYLELLTFSGTFLFGESFILAITVLAAEQQISLVAVFWLSILGTVSADIVWFLLGQKIAGFLRRRGSMQKKYDDYIQRLDAGNSARQFYYLLFFKFLYGTRIITILYTSSRNISLVRFFLFDLTGTIVWLFAVMAVGVLLWEGAVSALPVLRGVEYTLTAIILLIIVFNLGTRWLSKKILR